MKITIEATPKEVKELLRAIASSKEQPKKPKDWKHPEARF